MPTLEQSDPDCPLVQWPDEGMPVLVAVMMAGINVNLFVDQAVKLTHMFSHEFEVLRKDGTDDGIIPILIEHRAQAGILEALRMFGNGWKLSREVVGLAEDGGTDDV